jgi:hypothetical protein
MSALGQKQTYAVHNGISALPPKADMFSAVADVRYGPIADSCGATKKSLFDHLVGDLLEMYRYIETQRLGSLHIDYQLEFGRLNDAQSTVARYIVKRHGLPSQGWRTFLRNHAPDIAAMDLFVVPSIGFNLLYTLIIVSLGRRHLSQSLVAIKIAFQRDRRRE